MELGVIMDQSTSQGVVHIITISLSVFGVLELNRMKLQHFGEDFVLWMCKVHLFNEGILMEMQTYRSFYVIEML